MTSMHIIYTERHKRHATDAVLFEGRPFDTEEIPERVEIILRAVQEAQLGRVSTPVDHGIEPILAVHDVGFVDFLRTVYTKHAAYYKDDEPVFTWTFATRYNGRKPKSFLGLMGYYGTGSGTPVLEGTWEAAYWAAQCALSAADHVRAGERTAYALCRPPGHHAAPDLYGGLCYLNNAAVAARSLQTNGRVAILDVDYHHGNGTQMIFYSDPAVLFCSLHAHPDDDYPYYWGEAEERGEGPGEGYTYNWPLPRCIDDAGYLAVLDKALAVIDDFAPRYLVVSVGFDIVAGDPIGGFCVSSVCGLRGIGQRIAALNLPTVIVQEGGYLLDTLGESAVTFLQAFA
ncbi:MAG: histone deacetylase family protein [Anaerolineae bacterium]|nr:histone deacetylase family protein [Anaerolineae bacterium]